MKLLFASDSFKGSLKSEECAEMLSEAAHEVLGDRVECSCLAMADGGEGTVDAVLKAVGGERVNVLVHGPLGQMREASYAILEQGKAVVEMAQASGLTLLAADERNPLLSSTYGTGELMLDALNRGCRELYIALGGSATNDGGMGCMRALGVRFLDENGCELQGRGCDLIRVQSIDVSGMDNRLKTSKIVVMCDVVNPLCGPMGATHVFGAQKGADEAQLAELEAGMCHYRDLLFRTFGVQADELSGAGAAGGLGAALQVFLQASFQSGVETILALADFDDLARQADLVITGEGCADAQSLQGKVLSGVGAHCQRLGVPVVALVGMVRDGGEAVCKHGISALLASAPPDVPLAEAMAHAREYYRLAAKRLFRLLQEGKLLNLN